jgi:hypothetical protein
MRRESLRISEECSSAGSESMESLESVPRSTCMEDRARSLGSEKPLVFMVLVVLSASLAGGTWRESELIPPRPRHSLKMSSAEPFTERKSPYSKKRSAQEISPSCSGDPGTGCFLGRGSDPRRALRVGLRFGAQGVLTNNSALG